MSTTPVDLTAIRERLNAATPGPYEPTVDESGRTYGSVITVSHGDTIVYIDSRRSFEGPHNPNDNKGIYADTEFLAHSWQDISDLLGYVAELETACETLEQQVDDAYYAGEQDAHL